MNFISSIIRIIEIPHIKLIQNEIPWIMLRVEIPQDGLHQNSVIVEAKIWGDLAYEIQKYYYINDYLLIEGYLSTGFRNNLKKSPILTIFQIYPFFFHNSKNLTKLLK